MQLWTALFFGVRDTSAWDTDYKLALVIVNTGAGITDDSYTGDR